MNRHARSNQLIAWALRTAAALSGAIVLLIVVFLVAESLPALRHVGFARFFHDASWNPADGLYNVLPMVAGTLLVSAGAVLIATPLGIAAAIFCTFYAPAPVAQVYRRLVELLAGIPSVVFGLWGLVVLVPMIARVHPPGPSLLAGMIVLAIMILPTVALTTDATLSATPASMRRAAAALGLSRWAAVWGVALPAARPGLVTAVILETGRAIGETMAVLMVCGNVVRVPGSLFDPVRTLTANIALEMSYATEDHRAVLFVTGLVLVAIVAILVLAADSLTAEQARG